MHARSDAHLAPDNPRAGESTGWPIRSLLSRIAVLTKPRGLISDGIAEARLWTRLFGLICAACTVWTDWEEGVAKKNPNTLSVPPLHVHSGHQLASPTC